MTKDLTEGSPLTLILDFLFPVLLGYLFQQFYTVVDTIIVGKCIGVGALASVGATGSVNFLIIGFSMGLCGGFAIPVAQAFGAKDYHRMREYVANQKMLCILFSIALTIITTLLCRPLMKAMQTPDDIIDGAVAYIFIIFAGIPLCILYNSVSSIIRALGDSRTPVYFLLLSSVLNIGLDLAFILGLGMGVEGAALATIISQGIAGLSSFAFLKKHFPVLQSSAKEKRVNIRHWRVLLQNGLPMGLQYTITAIGSVILQSSVNTLGSGAVAAITAGSRVSMFFCTPFDAMGTTMATYGGQNTGRGRLFRLKTGMSDILGIALVYSLFAFVLMYFFGDRLSMLFLDAKEHEIIGNAHFFLIMNTAFYFPLAIVNIVRFMIQGMGFGPFAILSGVFEMVARIIIAVFIVPLFHFPGACFANPLAWAAADLFLIPAFFHCYHRLEQIHTPYLGGEDTQGKAPA